VVAVSLVFYERLFSFLPLSLSMCPTSAKHRWLIRVGYEGFELVMRLGVVWLDVGCFVGSSHYFLFILFFYSIH
jgi:hypothetical protein